MNTKCLGAYTAAGGSYPPYLSVNQRGHDTVEVTARGEPTEGHPGAVVMVSLSLVEFHALLTECARNIGSPGT